MEMITVCLGNPEHVEKGNELHKLLNTVLSEQIEPEEKKKKLEEEFDIVTTVELEGGLAAMCNLSDHIEERGMERGMEQGMLQTLFSLIEDNILPLDIAAQKAGFTIEDFKKQYQEYQKNK